MTDISKFMAEELAFAWEVTAATAEPGRAAALRECADTLRMLANRSPLLSQGTPIEAALDLAHTAHRGQCDKSGAPYIMHVIRVAMKLASDQVGQVVALLHDTVEDSGVTLAEIERQFGQEVAEAVDHLSRRKGETYEDFIQRCALNPLACKVKLADLADNMNISRIPSPTKSDWQRLERYRNAQRALLVASSRHRQAVGSP